MDGSLTLRWLRFRDSVANAYHDYGRLCAAHPMSCLTMSLLTMCVLSYPAITRLRLPVSTPIDVFWSEHSHLNENDKIAPYWANDNPASYIQQFIVTSTIRPWNSSALSPQHAVRAAVGSAFQIREILLAEDGIDDICLRLVPPSRYSKWPFRSKSACLILSPATIWYNDVEAFKSDQDVISTIFGEECKSTYCMRDLLLGAPIESTGIKPKYQTNRKRTIDFGITVFFGRYDKQLIENIKTKLKRVFKIIDSPANDDSTFVQVYFHPLKKFSDYTLLAFTYFLCMIYLYFSSRKFQMVASRWGLAFAASFTVFATLLMTTGICTHLDVSTTLWGAELYPYIALILGLENLLCITRSVVYTPPSLDVSSRIAHGLSREGYKLTKYFVLELFALFCGYLTRVSDIQEFCQFSAICIVVDFYMQLFFYSPCLTFDLQRLGHEQKRKFAEILFYAEIPRLKNYAHVSCPMRKFWPKLFELEKIKKRRLSDSEAEMLFSDGKDARKVPFKTDSEWKDDSELARVETESSNRMKIIYFITRTRIVQRTIIVSFILWTLWLAFIVGSRQVQLDSNSSTNNEATLESLSKSHRILSAANLKYGYWQRRTYKWWPPVAHEYNISLNSRYVTFLPPIIVDSVMSPEAEILRSTGASYNGSHGLSNEPILRSRIDWLENQLKMYLAAFWLLLLTTVLTFFVYLCFRDRWKFHFKRYSHTQSSNSSDSQPSNNIAERNFVETLPIAFNGHSFPVESICLEGALLVSFCQEGIVIVWNIETGEQMKRINRLRAVPEEGKEMPCSPKIWSICRREDSLFIGCADGSVEIASISRNKLIALYPPRDGLSTNIGVSHLICHGENLAVIRLDGCIEFLRIVYQNEESVIRIKRIDVWKNIRAHQKTISQIVEWNENIITSSFDRSIKMWSWSNAEMVNIFLAHNAPVLSVEIDVGKSRMFSSCEENIVCWWNLLNGDLIRTIDSNCSWAFQLNCTSEYLIGLYGNSQLFMWSLESGQLSCRITDGSTDEEEIYTVGNIGVVCFGEKIAATASGHSLTFWDLKHRAIIGKMKFKWKISWMRRLSTNNVICGVGNTMYAVTLPLIRIK